MHKKIGSKRKIKRTLNKIVFLGILFFTTLTILLIVYVVSTMKKHDIVSPITSIKNLPIKNIPAIDQNNALKILLEQQNISVKDTVSATDSSTLVTLDNGGEVLFSQKKNIQQQIASLQLIIRQLTIEGRQFKRIDLRFDNPVIVF